MAEKDPPKQHIEVVNIGSKCLIPFASNTPIGQINRFADLYVIKNCIYLVGAFNYINYLSQINGYGSFV